MKATPEPNSYERTHQEMDGMITDVHKQHPSYGYRMETGRKVCGHCVMKSMQRLGIHSKARKRQSAYVGTEHAVYPNILSRQFHPDQPMQKVEVDICQFKGGGQRWYFITYLDMFNNEMLTWNLGKQDDMSLVLPPLRRLLLTKEPDSPLLIHSDQGSQFASYSYTKLLEDYGVTQSMSRAGTPRDNAVIESCFGWFKNMLYWDFNIRKSENVSATVARAVEQYNRFRPAFALDYKTPEQFKAAQGF